MTNTIPPHNIEVEESILGGILLDSQAIDRIINDLDPNAFFVPSHRHIYQAALALHRAGQPVDLMTMTSWLKDHQLLEQVGGLGKINQLICHTVSTVNIDRYAALVMDKYLRRQLGIVGQEITQWSFDTTQELDTLFYQAEKRLFQVSQRRLNRSTQSNYDVAIQAYQALEKMDIPIYPTGLYDLDDLIVGWEAGTLTLLAGRPSMGKSFLAIFWAVMMMMEYNRSVAFFSLEMTKFQLEYRLWSLLSVLPHYNHLNLMPISSNRFRRHRSGSAQLESNEINTVTQIMSLAAEMPLYLNDDRGITVSGIASECRRLISEGQPLGLVIIDYLQVMAADSESGNRSYDLGDVARELYKMAGDINVPVLALSQVSRAVEGRSNKRPMMSDLSQSGILEMVADNIIFAYRDDYYHPETVDAEILELIIAKSRHDSTGTVKVLFDRAYGLIKNLKSDRR